jgi:hypothetical protein
MRSGRLVLRWLRIAAMELNHSIGVETMAEIDDAGIRVLRAALQNAHFVLINRNVLGNVLIPEWQDMAAKAEAGLTLAMDVVSPANLKKSA